MMERQSPFLIGGRKTTLYAAALEKPTFYFLHIASRFVPGSRIVLALIRPEAISDLHDSICSPGADTLPLEFFEGKMHIAFLFAQRSSQLCRCNRQSASTPLGM